MWAAVEVRELVALRLIASPPMPWPLLAPDGGDRLRRAADGYERRAAL
jgi:hypothetical protein